MAHLHPTLPHPRVVASQGLATEVAVLQRLQEGLPNAYTLFHSVDWMRPTESGTARGEIDIAVVNQAGDLCLLEVKAGDVKFTEGGIFKQYRPGHHAHGEPGRTRNVGSQLGLQYGSIKQRLNDLHLQVKVQQLLVLPHQRVEGETAQWPRERIIDAQEYPDLPHRIQQLLGPGVPEEHGHNAHETVLHFLSNHFKVHTDVASVLRQSEHSTSVLSAGLATWVPRIHAPDGVYRINATAGSGKTQLALQLLNAADAQGLRAAYLCFNSPLAALMAQRVKPRVSAQTFHHHARTICEGLGHRFDFTQAGVFNRMSQLAAEHLARPEAVPDLDLLVIDEMQDMDPQWAQALIHRLKPGGHAYLFEDTDQALYQDRQVFAVQGEVTITCNDNARSPRQVVKLINELRLTRQPISGLNPYGGSVAEPRVAHSEAELLLHTQAAVQDCLNLGFGLQDIVVLTGRGRESSQVLAHSHLGPWALKKASGQRDTGGQELLSPGVLLCETVHRFKGQAVGAVVLTELEFGSAQDPGAELRWHRLYVGLTRAQAHVGLVMGEEAARAVVERLSSGQS